MTANSNARRRQHLSKPPKHEVATGPRVINAAPSLEKAEMYGVNDERPVFSRVMALAGRIFIETIPQWLAIGAMLGLIFGGCCSNVFALEAIIQIEPASGSSPPRGTGNISVERLTEAGRHSSDLRPVPVRRRHRLRVPV